MHMIKSSRLSPHFYFCTVCNKNLGRKEPGMRLGDIISTNFGTVHPLNDFYPHMHKCTEVLSRSSTTTLLDLSPTKGHIRRLHFTQLVSMDTLTLQSSFWNQILISTLTSGMHMVYVSTNNNYTTSREIIAKNKTHRLSGKAYEGLEFTIVISFLLIQRYNNFSESHRSCRV